MGGSALRRHPFLRLLLPLAVGVYVGLEHDVVPFSVGGLYACVLAAFLIVLAGYVLRHRLPSLFAVALNVFLISLGYVLAARQMRAVVFEPSDHAGIYVFKVVDPPEVKPRTLMCRSVLCPTADTLTTVSGRTFLLYVSKDSLAASIDVGDSLLVYASLAPARNNGIPYEFDYARYLRLKGVSGTAYVAAGHWEVVGKDTTRQLSQRLSQWHDAVADMYVSLGFHDDNLAVLSALTLGDKDDLSDDLRETYSVAGVSHVLALSGMHVGLVYAFLLLLLRPLWRRQRWIKSFSVLLVVAVLWLFAVFTGLSTSVVRSVTMFSMLALANLLPERPHTLNTLAVTAFMMLMVRPQWLLDVGFQLSFVAVFFIVVLQPRIFALFPSTDNKLLRWLFGLISVSVSAQLGTAPLVVLYFHRFSTHFLLSNVCVLPLVTLVMYLALIMLMLTPFPLIQHPVAVALRWCIDVQNAVLGKVSALPYAVADNLWIDEAEVLMFYLALALLLWYFGHRVAGRLLAALGMLLICLSYHAWQLLDHRPQPGISFYNVSGTPAAHCIDASGQSMLFTPQGTDVGYLLQAIKPVCSRLSVQMPEVLQGDTLLTSAQFAGHILSFEGRRVCFVVDDSWRYLPAGQRLHVDVAYISRGYRGTLQQLLQHFDVGSVVVDSSLSAFYTDRLSAECDELGIPLTLLSQAGHYTLQF